MKTSRFLCAAGFGFSLQVLVSSGATLVMQSPFLPAPGSVAAAPAENAPIELRGIQGSRFCIYDTARKTSVWVGLNEKGYDFVIKSQDAAKDTVTIEQGGRTFPLKLRDAKIAAGPAMAMPMPGPGAPAVAGPNPVTQNVVLNPTPADEAKRLEDTVSEIQRRRALREQAQQTVAGGQATPANPPAPQNVTPAPGGGAPAQSATPANRVIR